MKAFTCKTCKVRQTEVGTVSTCTQKYDIENKDWGDINPEEMLNGYCLNCGAEISLEQLDKIIEG